jgi:anti-sigma-K factor RskA
MAPALWNTQMSEDSGAQLPASYVGVLGTADGKPGLIVSSLRHGRFVDIKQIAPMVVPLGMRLYLWRIDVAGKAMPLGPLPAGKWVRMPLPETAEKIFFPAVELAVSVESADDTPQAPRLPFVYRGLCGKLWK